MKTIYISKNEVISLNLFTSFVGLLKYICKTSVRARVIPIDGLAFIDGDSVLIKEVNLDTLQSEAHVYTIDTKDKKKYTFFHSSIKSDWCIGDILSKAKEYNFIGPDELNKYEVSTNEIRYMFINILKEVLDIQNMDVILDRNLKDMIYVTSCFLEGQHDDIVDKCPPNILISSYLLLIRTMISNTQTQVSLGGVIGRLLKDKESCNSLKNFLDILKDETKADYNIRNITTEYRNYLSYYFSTNGKAGNDFITAVRMFCLFIAISYTTDLGTSKKVHMRIRFNKHIDSEKPYIEIYNKLFKKHVFKLFQIHDILNIASISIVNHENDGRGENNILVTDPNNILDAYQDLFTSDIINTRIDVVRNEKMYMKNIEAEEYNQK